MEMRLSAEEIGSLLECNASSLSCIEDCELESDIDTTVQDNNSVFRQLHYNVLTPDLVAPELETNVKEIHDTILCQPLDSNETDANETYFAGDLSENFNVNSLEVRHEVTLVLNVLPSESTNFSEGIPNNINPVNDNDPPKKKNYHTNEEEHNGMAVKDDMEVEETEESEDELPQDQKTRSRKRLVNRKNWKSETINRKRQSGQEYGDQKGKVHRGKMVQGECKGTCKFQCAKKITKDERNQIHKRFWSLSDTGKNHFYSKFVK
ncbi:hypothetical protein J6590_085697 [Homalodisca vitripennis]|nr:hypothetical protein J6590_085697 [Homalodisca vitripennis]